MNTVVLHFIQVDLTRFWLHVCGHLFDTKIYFRRISFDYTRFSNVQALIIALYMVLLSQSKWFEELLKSHNSELTEEELFEMAKNDDVVMDYDVTQTATLTLNILLHYLSISSELTYLLVVKDSLMQRSLKVKQELHLP